METITIYRCSRKGEITTHELVKVQDDEFGALYETIGDSEPYICDYLKHLSLNESKAIKAAIVEQENKVITCKRVLKDEQMRLERLLKLKK